jgi:hypothetical protein
MAAPNYFVPNQVVITKIVTRLIGGQQTLGVTTTPNIFKTGLYVRFVIPKACGMIQLDGVVAQVLALNNTLFLVYIDGTKFDPFIPNPFPLATQLYVAQVIPVSEDALYLPNLQEAVVNNNNIIPETLGTIPLTTQYQLAHRIIP